MNKEFLYSTCCASPPTAEGDSPALVAGEWLDEEMSGTGFNTSDMEDAYWVIAPATCGGQWKFSASLTTRDQAAPCGPYTHAPADSHRFAVSPVPSLQAARGGKIEDKGVWRRVFYAPAVREDTAVSGRREGDAHALPKFAGPREVLAGAEEGEAGS